MANNTSYHFEYIDNDENSSIDTELICIICKQPFDDPRCTPCDHLFCAHCITQWIQRDNPTCPTCREHVSLTSLIQVNRPLRNMLARLHIKCLQCGQIGIQRSNFDNHINETCPKTEVVCAAVDILCPWKGPREELNDHLVQCLFAPLREVLQPVLDEYRQLKEQKTKIEQFQQQLLDYQNQILKLTTQNRELSKQIANQNNIAEITATANNVHERFISPFGDNVMLFDDGRVCERSRDNHLNGLVVGQCFYSSSSNIRLQIEDGWAFLGILSEKIYPSANIKQYIASLPLLQRSGSLASLDSIPSVYGWWTTGWMIRNGKKEGMYANEKHQPNDIYQLILNCGIAGGQYCLGIMNERTREKSKMDVSLKDAPLPWRLLVIFSQRGGRVRIV